MQGCLYMNWMSILAVSSPFFLWCPVKQKVKLQHMTSASSTPIPRCFFGSFLKKSDVSLNQAVTRIPVRSIFFPPSGSLVTIFVWKFDSLAIYGVQCCISVGFFKAHTELQGLPWKTLQEFPINFIIVQLLLQNYFFPEVQCLHWCHHFWTWILQFLYWNKISRPATGIYVDLTLTISSLYSPGQRAMKIKIITNFRKGNFLLCSIVCQKKRKLWKVIFRKFLLPQSRSLWQPLQG